MNTCNGDERVKIIYKRIDLSLIVVHIVSFSIMYIRLSLYIRKLAW